MAVFLIVRFLGMDAACVFFCSFEYEGFCVKMVLAVLVDHPVTLMRGSSADSVKWKE